MRLNGVELGHVGVTCDMWGHMRGRVGSQRPPHLPRVEQAAVDRAARVAAVDVDRAEARLLVGRAVTRDVVGKVGLLPRDAVLADHRRVELNLTPRPVEVRA
eukprot:1187087-Prymnesium_polylepis.1